MRGRLSCIDMALDRVVPPRASSCITESCCLCFGTDQSEFSTCPVPWMVVEQCDKTRQACSDLVAGLMSALRHAVTSLLSGGSPALASGVTLPWHICLNPASGPLNRLGDAMWSYTSRVLFVCVLANMHHIWPHTSVRNKSAGPLRWAMASFD